MSQDQVTIPPPGVVHVTSLGLSVKSSNNNGKVPQKANLVPESRIKPSATDSTKANVAQPTRKRRSRFSDAPPAQHASLPAILQIMPPPPPAKVITGSKKIASGTVDKSTGLVSAVAAAARINANLLAQGKIKSLPNVSQYAELTSKSTAPTVSIAPDETQPVISPEIKRVDDMYVTEVGINDIPIGCRNYLTRLTTQENINKSCMAYVSTRGKFMLPEEKKHGVVGGIEKPLYLYVQSQNEENVRRAVTRINQIISNHYAKKHKPIAELPSSTVSSPLTTSSIGMMASMAQHGFVPGYPLIQNPTSLPHCQPMLPSGNYVQEKLFIGLDSTPEHLDVKNKLLGPNYRNFTFIANQTGAKVILRGRGSGFIEPTSGREAFESMYAFISHPNQAGVEAAKKLVLNLIGTIKTELAPYIAQSKNLADSAPGFGQAKGSFEGNNKPTMVPPPALAMAPGSVTMYPFQKQGISPSTYPSPSGSSSTIYQGRYDPEDSVLGYQHNFTGKSKDSSKDASRKSKDKSRKKRFTEESPIPPALPPPAKSKKKEADSDDTPSEDERRSGAKGEPFKMPMLPFWMTP